MSQILRNYQESAVSDALEYINSSSNKKVIIVQGVGFGKSHIIASIANKMTEPVIVSQNSKELLLQNIQKFRDYGNKASVFSAGLNSRELGQVTFGTIKTMMTATKQIKELGVKLLICDEAHQASKHGSELSKFLNETGIKKVIGLTATPVVLNSWQGVSYLTMLNRSRKNIFQEIIHCTQIKEIVDGGFWTPILYDDKQVDSSQLKLNTSGTDYLDTSLENFYEQNKLKNKILVEVEKLQKNGRKSTLIFVPSIARAEQLARIIPNSACVHSKTPQKERDIIIKNFKNLQLPVCINVGVLLTGFDHVLLDSIIHARPSNSFIIWYQSCGRIVRPHLNKKNGLICDYSGGLKKFGKLEDISFQESEGRWGMFSNDIQLTVGEVFKYNKNTFDGIIWFGIHKGKHIKDCPINYLKWVLENFKADTPKVKQMLIDISNYLISVKIS